MKELPEGTGESVGEQEEAICGMSRTVLCGWVCTNVPRRSLMLEDTAPNAAIEILKHQFEISPPPSISQIPVLED